MDSGGKFTLYSGDFNLLEENYTYYELYDYEGSCCGMLCGQEASMAFEAIFIPILYSLAVVIGLLGNVLVLVVLWQKKRAWSMPDTFVLHLSVADILLLLTMPLWAVEAVNEWIFGIELCKLAGALFQVNFYCVIFLLVCISLDHYLSIVHAVQMFSLKKPWLIQLSCMAVWFFSLLLSIPDWVYLGATEDSRRGKTECVHWYPSDGWRLASRLLYHVVGFVIPALVLVFCYTRILLKLQRGSQSLQKQRAVRVILALVVAFFICKTPYNITLMVDTIHGSPSNYISDICDSTTALDIAMTATSTLGYLHCCINSVLYALFEVKFRRHLQDMVRPISCRCVDTSHSSFKS
uniref:G-protein coupled receptors family 1 profile domain-containing protein n=1 Tax=Pygocentrus nattereri TaxID=42514 RepID=A0AAR2K4J9_PYGNA